MGRGKKDKPADSSAEEPDNPPPVAPRPRTDEGSFEQEKSTKKADKGKKGKKKDAGGIKGPNGKTFKKGERRLANRQERERKGKAFLEVTWMVDERKCQDMIFCLAMLLYWVAMIYIFKIAVDSGNVAILLMPVDQEKNTCGMDNGPGKDFRTCTNLYFNDPLGSPESRICVETCPTTQLDIVCHCGSCGTHSNNSAWGAPSTSTTPGVVPVADIVTWARAKQEMDARPDDYTMNLLPGSRIPLPEVNGQEVGGYCIPSGNVTELIMDTLGKDDTLTGGLKDGFTHRWPIIYGIIASVIVGFIFLYFVAWFTKPLAYLILTATVLASFCIFILSLYEGQRAPWLFPEAVGSFINARGPRVPEDLAENQLYLDISTGFWGVIFCCSFVVLAAMRQRLAIAIGVVEESSRALVGMPTLLLVPIGSLITMLLLLPFLGLGIGAVVSLRQWRDGGWVYPDEVKGMLAIYTFGAIWLYTFIDALQFTALAGAVCDWYFCMDKAKRQGGLDAATTLFRSYLRLVRYHLGSIAFGSFVVAVVKSIKYILAYISSQVQAQFPGNVAVKIIIAILNCCVACFERLVKYLTETAYIQVAIWGRNFCRSALYGLKLSITNMGRLAFVTILSKCLIILGTLEISVASAATCAFFIFAEDSLPPTGYCEMESPEHLDVGLCTSSIVRPVDPRLANNERVLQPVYNEGYNPQWATDLDLAGTECLTDPCDEATCLQYGTCQVDGQASSATTLGTCGQCEVNGAVDDQLASADDCTDGGGTWASGTFDVSGVWHRSCEGDVSWDGPTINSINELIMRPAVAIALLMGYLVGFVFMDCYDTTIHTIIICFCEDEKYCDGGDADMAPEDYPYYASGSLEEVLGPALKFGAKKKKSGREVTNAGMDFKKKLVQLKQEEEMDAKEKEEAQKDGKKGKGDEKSFEERRKELQKEAEENVAKIKQKEKAELATVAAKMKADASKRKAMRKAGAPSTKNIDKAHFIEKCEACTVKFRISVIGYVDCAMYGADLKAQGRDASKEFDALDTDGSGDLSAVELEQFKQLRAVGTVEV